MSLKRVAEVLLGKCLNQHLRFALVREVLRGKDGGKLSKLVKYCWGEDDAVFLPAIIYFLLLPIICNIRLQGDLLLCRRSFVIAPILVKYLSNVGFDL